MNEIIQYILNFDIGAVLNITGIIIGIIGLVYAFYENRQHKKLSEHIRANNWFNYQRINNENGIVQLAKKLYMEKHKDNLDPEVLDNLSKADAHGQEIFKETIRQIQLSEPSFTSSDFERWKKEGKLNEQKEALFKIFAIDAKLK